MQRESPATSPLTGEGQAVLRVRSVPRTSTAAKAVYADAWRARLKRCWFDRRLPVKASSRWHLLAAHHLAARWLSRPKIRRPTDNGGRADTGWLVTQGSLIAKEPNAEAQHTGKTRQKGSGTPSRVRLGHLDCPANGRSAPAFAALRPATRVATNEGDGEGYQVEILLFEGDGNQEGGAGR